MRQDIGGDLVRVEPARGSGRADVERYAPKRTGSPQPVGSAADAALKRILMRGAREAAAAGEAFVDLPRLVGSARDRLFDQRVKTPVGDHLAQRCMRGERRADV